MGYKCSVLGCSSGKSIPKHYFPKDEIRALTWRAMIKCEPKMYQISSDLLWKYPLCHKHFSSSMIKVSGNRRCLKEDAYPDVDVDRQALISSAQAINFHTNLHLDHDNSCVVAVDHQDSFLSLDAAVPAPLSVDASAKVDNSKIRDLVVVNSLHDSLGDKNNLATANAALVSFIQYWNSNIIF